MDAQNRVLINSKWKQVCKARDQNGQTSTATLLYGLWASEFTVITKTHLYSWIKPVSKTLAVSHICAIRHCEVGKACGTALCSLLFIPLVLGAPRKLVGITRYRAPAVSFDRKQRGSPQPFCSTALRSGNRT